MGDHDAATCDQLIDLLDSAYDAKDTRAHSPELKHVPLTDTNPYNRKADYGRERQTQRSAGAMLLERGRTTAGGAFGRLSASNLVDVMSGGWLPEVQCHLMFVVVVLAIDQLLRMIQYT